MPFQDRRDIGETVVHLLGVTAALNLLGPGAIAAPSAGHRGHGVSRATVAMATWHRLAAESRPDTVAAMQSDAWIGLPVADQDRGL